MFERVKYMSLQPNGSSNSIEQQDRCEFASSVFFENIYKSLPKEQKKAFGVTTMLAVRDRWNKDFSRESLKISDFAKMADLLPADPIFDQAKAQLKDKEYVKATVGEARATFNNYKARNLYPVTILDPQLRDVPGMSEIRKMVVLSENQSVRSLNKGQGIALQSINGQSLYTPPVAIAAATSLSSISPDEDAPDHDTQDIIGWSSTADTKGLDKVLGAYFTQADQMILAKRFDSPKGILNGATVFRGEDLDGIYNAQEVLKYLHSNGLNFGVKEFAVGNEIEVKLESNRFDLRVFDTEKQYIGRVFDGYGSYYLSGKDQRNAKDMKWSVEESLAPLQVLMGHRNGTMRKSGTKSTSQIQNIDGMPRNRWVQANMLKDRYDALVYNTEDEARQFIDNAIYGAKGYFDQEFKADQLMLAIDNEEMDIESIYSKDEVIREKQEGFLNDVGIISDMANAGMDDTMLSLLQAVNPKLLDLNAVTNDPAEMGELVHQTIFNDMVGSYEAGFNPSFVIDHAPQDEKRQHTRNALMGALRKTNYDLNDLRGNAFATQNIKDNLIAFNPETARGIDDMDDPYLKGAMERVRENLVDMGVIGENGEGAPLVQMDDKGVIEWQGHRMLLPKAKTSRKDPSSLKVDGNFYEETLLKGEIGQIFSPNEKNIIKTQFGSGEDYGIVPGYTGYFKFDGEYQENYMDNFRVKGFDQHLNEKMDVLVRNQVLRPIKPTWDNIPNAMDASGLNGLYHGDVYGRRMDLDFVETSRLKPEVSDAILTTLSKRVRFDNQYSDYATTSAETRAERDTSHDDEAAFSIWKAAGETNMRVTGDEWANIVDLDMTGTGKTQGLVKYLTDGTRVDDKGVVTPSAGTMQLDGTIKPDQTAVMKLDYFKDKDHNAWDRVQMSANQVMTAVTVDEKVGTALMSFGGWTFDDSYAVSRDFAERNPVFGAKPNEDSMKVLNEALRHLDQGTLSRHRDMDDYFAEHHMKWSDEVIGEGLDLVRGTMVNDRTERAENRKAYENFLEEHGRFRPLKPGDKISDFGGNKGTIGIVIDRNMNPEEAKKQKLDHEVAIFNANPQLDVVGAPYSMLSRHNAGVVQELMDGDVQDIVDPTTGEVFEGAMGHLNIIVTDLTVDEKTHAYSDADVANGKGRKASGQLAWALQSKGADGVLNEIYGNNVGPWSTFREYLIATGLDMEQDGTLRHGYQPHEGADGTEIRHTLNPDDFESSAEFLNEISDKGGFLEVPFELEFQTGAKTTNVPVLSSALRQNTELIDGRMRRSDFNNHYMAMFDAVKQYKDNENERVFDRPESFDTPADEAKYDKKLEAMEKARVENKQKAMDNAQKSFDGIQNEIIDRQFNGGHNGKHSFIRDKIMGRRMKDSATGVAIVDPRLDIGEASMDSEMMAALNAKQGDTVMAWRDPVWRDGAIRAFTVKLDENIHGIAINPISDKSHDMDFDGDTMGIVKLESKQATKDLMDKFSHANNMIDLGSGHGDLYFQSGMDLASAEHKATSQGDTKMTELMESVKKNAVSDKISLRKKALNDLTTYSHEGFRKHGFGGDYVNLTNNETQHASFKAMVDKGAKGSQGKLDTYQDYFDGKKTREDAKKIQYATGIKSDDTGLAGSVSQKLVSVLRNQGIKPALELTYPVTQGTLQIKHDAEHAIVVNKVLTKDLPNLYKGKSPDGKQKNVTTNSWKRQMSDVLENKLNVSYNEEYLDEIANALSKKGVVQPIDVVMAEKGSPMDQIAYGGGYNAIKRLATNGRSMLEGEQSKLFAPMDMRNGKAGVLSKADTRNVTAELELDAMIDSRITDQISTTSTAKAPQATASAAAQVAVIEDDGMEP